MTNVIEMPRRGARVYASIDALFKGRRVDAEVFASALGCSRASMYKKLKGESPITVDEAERAADFFGVPVAALFDGLGGYFGGPSPTDTRQYLASVLQFPGLPLAPLAQAA